MNKKVSYKEKYLEEMGYSKAPIRQIFMLDLNTTDKEILLTLFTHSKDWKTSLSQIKKMFFKQRRLDYVKKSMEKLKAMGYVKEDDNTYFIDLEKIQADYLKNFELVKTKRSIEKKKENENYRSKDKETVTDDLSEDNTVNTPTPNTTENTLASTTENTPTPNKNNITTLLSLIKKNMNTNATDIDTDKMSKDELKKYNEKKQNHEMNISTDYEHNSIYFDDADLINTYNLVKYKWKINLEQGMPIDVFEKCLLVACFGVLHDAGKEINPTNVSKLVKLIGNSPDKANNIRKQVNNIVKNIEAYEKQFAHVFIDYKKPEVKTVETEIDLTPIGGKDVSFDDKPKAEIKYRSLFFGTELTIRMNNIYDTSKLKNVLSYNHFEKLFVYTYHNICLKNDLEHMITRDELIKFLNTKDSSEYINNIVNAINVDLLKNDNEIEIVKMIEDYKL